MIKDVFDDKLLKHTVETKKLLDEKMRTAHKLVDELPEGSQKKGLKSILKAASRGEVNTEALIRQLNKIAHAG